MPKHGSFFRAREMKAEKRNFRKYWPAYLFILPTFVFIGVFFYQPFVASISYSFYKWMGIGPKTYVGVGNYVSLFRDPRFWFSMRNILILTAAGIIKMLSFPMITAALIANMRAQRFAYALRSLFIFPIVVPGLVFLLLWKNVIFDPNIGVLNYLLKTVLGGRGLLFLQDPDIALLWVAVVGFPWIGALPFLVYLSAFQGISKDIFDAAAIDGVSGIRRFLRIEFPMILDQIKVLITLTIITTFQEYYALYVLTDGGPMSTTLVPGLMLFKSAFEEYHFGYASSVGVIMLLVMLVLSYINNRYVRSKVEY